jgi:dTDP-4-amino-4,6-dideoxygalactose transaminase
MLEVQAAVGRDQLGMMEQWSDRRREIALRIKGALDRFEGGVRVPVPPANMRHAYYRQYAYVRPEGLREGWSRDRIVAEVNAAKVPLLHGSCSEIYLEKAFDGTSWRPAEPLPVARELGETSLMFLTHPTITDEQLGNVLDVTTSVLERACR